MELAGVGGPKTKINEKATSSCFFPGQAGGLGSGSHLDQSQKLSNSGLSGSPAHVPGACVW